METVQSVVTSKFQTTIPKKIREALKLSVNDALEWRIERGRLVVYPVQSRFLRHQNTIHIGAGDIADDIAQARLRRVEKFR